MTETVKLVAVVVAVKVPVGEMDSQVSPLQLCSVTEAVVLVLACAVTARVWVAGAELPAVALNVKLVGLNVSGPVDALVTLRVTLTDCVPEEVTREIVPVHWVPPEIPV